MSKIKEKLVLFDFCDTIVGFQTANQYVRYVVKNHSMKSIKIRHVVYIFLLKLRIIKLLEFLCPEKNVQKRILLWQLKNIRKDVLDNAAREFYTHSIKKSLISKTINELHKYISEGVTIAIVSGGYDIYIKYFAQDFGIKLENVLANKLVFKDNIFTGTFDIDCMGNTKVQLLDRQFRKEDFHIIAYSDSESDLPMLTWAHEGYVICKTPTWIQSNNLKIINC
jgi:HAD superfamily hydrolase (TIGR01490 family)